MKLQLASQAHVVFIAAVVLAIALLIPTRINVVDPDTGNLRVLEYDLKKRLAMILLLSLPLAVHIYTINCMVVGHCNVFSWFIASLILVWVVCFLILAFA
jgi:hypothetical protein